MVIAPWEVTDCHGEKVTEAPGLPGRPHPATAEACLGLDRLDHPVGLHDDDTTDDRRRP